MRKPSNGIQLANFKPYVSNFDYMSIAKSTLTILKRISQELNNKNYDHNGIHIQLEGIERQIITTRRAFSNEIFSLDSTHEYAQHAKKNRNNRIFVSGKNWPSISEMNKILKNVYRSGSKKK